MGRNPGIKEEKEQAGPEDAGGLARPQTHPREERILPEICQRLEGLARKLSVFLAALRTWGAADGVCSISTVPMTGKHHPTSLYPKKACNLKRQTETGLQNPGIPWYARSSEEGCIEPATTSTLAKVDVQSIAKGSSESKSCR
ncbi:hypothetical protein NDU88_002977 [Pleurodeles waltl]|uniref:Uncharacterized protein n=1 Tax=Pleurodeles waltl TaxID=8319 RepID=A0AAV7SC37_PLEWA|nr:hypothetical protein NDU88_002977 [Pleurodeles waltl]